MTKITITETPLSKPSDSGPMPTGEIVWGLVIEVGGKKVVEETCWDYAEARRKADEFMGISEPAKDCIAACRRIAADFARDKYDISVGAIEDAVAAAQLLETGGVR